MVRERSDTVPSRTAGALPLQSGACSARRPAHTAPAREERRLLRHANNPRAERNDHAFTFHQIRYDIRLDRNAGLAENGQGPMHETPIMRGGISGMSARAELSPCLLRAAGRSRPPGERQ